jgi:hypothetical protein
MARRESPDRAVGTIDDQMAGQPEVQADLLEIMGLSYSGLGLTDRFSISSNGCRHSHACSGLRTRD